MKLLTYDYTLLRQYRASFCFFHLSLFRFFFLFSRFSFRTCALSIGNVREEIRDRFSVVSPPHRFGEHHGNVDALKNVTKRINYRVFEGIFQLLSDWEFLVVFTWILGQSFMWLSWGIVLVTTTASKQALLILQIAGPLKMPWVRIA